MLKIYYTIITRLPPPGVIQNKLQVLPLALQQKISAYKKPLQQVLQLSSKLLLRQLIASFGLDGLIGLHNVTSGKNGKPCFNKALYFNSARSGNIAVCAATTTGDIGIDIEKIVPVDFTLYREYCTISEWDEINTSKNQLETFFSLWTKKEAVVKASGGGLNFALNSFEVLNNPVKLNGTDYYLRPVSLQDGYVCHVASVVENVELEAKEIVLWEGVHECIAKGLPGEVF